MIYLKRSLASTIISVGCLISSALTYASPPLEFYPSYQQILQNTYELKAASAEINAKQAEAWQAGAFPNPALIANLNSIGRDQDGEENELFVGVVQRIELGGKRAARLRVASADHCSSEWDLEIAKNKLFIKLQHAFIDMAVAQERESLAKGQLRIAEQTLATISCKSNCGNSSGIEEKKAQVAFRSANLAYLKQLANLKKAKKQLASIWDCSPPCFETVNYPLRQTIPPPPLETLTAGIACTPEMIKAEAESYLAAEVVSLERSRRIPDIEFQVGVLSERFVKEPALCIGIGIPLPLFDQNEGNISRASYVELQAIYHQMDLQNNLQNELEILYHEWTSAFEQALILQESILPVAEGTFQLAQVGFNEGKFNYLDLLDARSTLFDVQQQYLDAVEEYHHKRTEVFKLTATYSHNEI